jgi:hypothetical protein
MSKGDQFAPIEAPYLKLWRERLNGEESLQSKRLADEQIGKVVEKIRTAQPPRTGKKRAGGFGRRHDAKQKAE